MYENDLNGMYFDRLSDYVLKFVFRLVCFNESLFTKKKEKK